MRAPPTGSLIEPNAGNPKLSLYEQGYKEIPATYSERFNEKSIMLRIRKQIYVQVSNNMTLDKLLSSCEPQFS